MRYFEFLKTIKNISTTHVLVNEYGEGDIYEHLNSGEHKYPCVFLTVTNIQSSVSSTLYNFTIFYTDRLVESGNNRTNIQSTGINVIQQILNRLIQEYPTFEVTDTNFTPFTEKFADMCAGVFCDVVLDNPLEKTTDEVECDNEGNFESKTITLTKNGLYDVIGYDKAIVNIPLTKLTVENYGTYENTEGGWNEVEVKEFVKLQEEKFVEISNIEDNYIDVLPDSGFDGIKSVLVHNNTKSKLKSANRTIYRNETYSIVPQQGEVFDLVTVTADIYPSIDFVTQDYFNRLRFKLPNKNYPIYNIIDENDGTVVRTYVVGENKQIIWEKPSKKGDIFYIEAATDECYILYKNSNSLLYNKRGSLEYSYNKSAWYSLSGIELKENNYIYLPHKHDRIYIRNKSGDITNGIKNGVRYFYQILPHVDSSNESIQYSTVNVGGDLHTLMFKYDTEVTAITKAQAFSKLFVNAYTLRSAEDLILPATSIGNSVYSDMFMDCTNLRYAPKRLEVMNFTGTYACNRMFGGCISLVTAPELPATTLYNTCYSLMFNDCSSLNEITCYAQNYSANFMPNWVLGVSTTGTFKTPNPDIWSRGVNGIPENWEVIDYIE